MCGKEFQRRGSQARKRRHSKKLYFPVKFYNALLRRADRDTMTNATQQPNKTQFKNTQRFSVFVNAGTRNTFSTAENSSSVTQFTLHDSRIPTRQCAVNTSYTLRKT